jgi:hypothetical protein
MKICEESKEERILILYKERTAAINNYPVSTMLKEKDDELMK